MMTFEDLCILFSIGVIFISFILLGVIFVPRTIERLLDKRFKSKNEKLGRKVYHNDISLREFTLYDRLYLNQEPVVIFCYHREYSQSFKYSIVKYTVRKGDGTLVIVHENELSYSPVYLEYDPSQQKDRDCDL